MCKFFLVFTWITLYSNILATFCEFVSCFVGAQESLNEKVTLKPCDKCNLDTIASSQDYQTLANSSEGLQMMEECIGVWIRQIEQVVN